MQGAVAYYRVSTNKQSCSGLGLEAQRRAIGDFAKYNGYNVIGEYTEVESGKRNDRAVLHAALDLCKREGAFYQYLLCYLNLSMPSKSFLYGYCKYLL